MRRPDVLTIALLTAAGMRLSTGIECATALYGKLDQVAGYGNDRDTTHASGRKRPNG